MATETIDSAPPPPPRNRWGRALDTIDDRMGISALAYPVPEHANNLEPRIVHLYLPADSRAVSQQIDFCIQT